MPSKQITFDGEEAPSRIIPNTFIVCRECGERVLRSRVQEHPHSLDDGCRGNAIRCSVKLALSIEDKVDIDPLAVDPETNIEEEVRRKANERFLNIANDMGPRVEALEKEEVPMDDAYPISL